MPESEIKKLSRAIESFEKQQQEFGLDLATQIRELQERLEKAKKSGPAGKAKRSGKASQTGSGGRATSGGVAAGDRGIAIGGHVFGSVSVQNRYEGPAPKAKDEQRRIYLEVLARLVNRLPMRAIDTIQSSPNAAGRELSLVNVYTALDTMDQVKREKEAARQGTERQPEWLERGETRPLRALEAAARQRWLVLLGEPGSGKTAFIHHLIYCLACGEAKGTAEWIKDFRRDWPPADRAILPIRVILRDFDTWLASTKRGTDQMTPQVLRAFVAQVLKQHNLDFAADLIDEALDAGKALVVLDGLDEVTSVPQRRIVRDAIAAFADRYRKSRFLVTCRTLSYQKPESKNEADLRLPTTDFPEMHLAPFDDGKINQFIAAWHNELTNAGKLSAAKSGVLQPKLIRAVRQPDLHRLACNPLQLTLMAWVHTDDEELPDKRAKLYDRSVDLLLWRWETQKYEAEGVRTLRELAGDVSDGRSQIERVLWRVAFQAHAQITPQDQRDNPERLADVNEAQLKSDLAQLKKDAQDKPDENWARDVVDAIRNRSGLLARRLPGTLTFPHRTFQEYLAALWLLQDRFVIQASERSAQFDVWREVILLAVGHSVYVKKDYELEKPLLLVRRLCPVSCEDAEAAWRKVWLAGDALLEMGVTRASEMDVDIVPRVQQQLVQLLAGARLSPSERAAAGNTLARLGDPRPDVMTLESMPFCYVPAGAFIMGEGKGEHTSKYLEYDYWIGRYPLTNAQFNRFVEAGGYREARYWREAKAHGWWKGGGFKSRFDDEPGVRPIDFGEPFNLSNHPVVGVSWYEALAFTRWLTEMWTAKKRLPPGWEVRLPSEVEWEKAARGGIEIPNQAVVRSNLGPIDPPALMKNPQPRRLYPWGEEPDPAQANYIDTRIGATSPVGCFPSGSARLYGCEDLSGNVWEWTRSPWGEDAVKPEFEYSYKGEEHENLKASREVVSVLRGGSFNFDRQVVRCAYRDGLNPYFRFYYIGFRVVVLPSSHSGL